MKWIKWILVGAGGLVVLVIVLVVSFLATFDPNSYKSELAGAVLEQTGRELAIPGDVGISYFPWLGFETGSVSLGNASGFGDQPFAQIAGVKVKVEVLPLLRRVLSVDVVELSGLRLDLRKREDGTSNWDDLAGAGASGDPAAPAPPPATDGDPSADAPSSSTPVLAALSVGGLRIDDAAIRYRDAQSALDVALDEVSISTGKVTLGRPFKVEFSAKATVNEPSLTASVRMSARVNADLNTQRYAITDLDLTTELAGDPVPAGAMRVALSGGVAADLAAQSARISALRVEAGALAAVLDGQVTQLDKTPRFDLELEVPSFDARQLMQELALAPVDTADPEAMRKVSAKARATGSPAAIDIKSLAISLDDTRIDASAEVRELDKPDRLPRIAARADISSIDLDRYLPPEPAEPAAESGAGTSTGGADAPPAADTPIGLPVDLLRALDARAELAIGALTVKKLNASDIAMILTARDGVVRLDPLSLALYEGSFNGTTVVDVRGAQPKFDVRAKLAGVQSGPLLQDYMGDDKVLGRSDATLAITTGGETVGALKKALNGTVALSFRDGAIKDFNIAEQLRVAEARLKKQDYRSEGTRPTDFSSLTVSGQFKNGVLHTDDLDMRSPLLRVSGKGKVNVAAENMDYLAIVTLTDKKTGQGGEVGEDLRGLPIPVRVKGAFAEPKVKLELAKALEARARAALERATAAEKARLQQEADAYKAELAKQAEEEKAKAKAKAEKERKKQEKKLKKKAEKALKDLLD